MYIKFMHNTLLLMEYSIDCLFLYSNEQLCATIFSIPSHDMFLKYLHPKWPSSDFQGGLEESQIKAVMCSIYVPNNLNFLLYEVEMLEGNFIPGIEMKAMADSALVLVVAQTRWSLNTYQVMEDLTAVTLASGIAAAANANATKCKYMIRSSSSKDSEPTNSNYELGRGNKVGGWKPQPIPSLEDVRIVQIASGGYHSFALTVTLKQYHLFQIKEKYLHKAMVDMVNWIIHPSRISKFQLRDVFEAIGEMGSGVFSISICLRARDYLQKKEGRGCQWPEACLAWPSLDRLLMGEAVAVSGAEALRSLKFRNHFRHDFVMVTNESTIVLVVVLEAKFSSGDSMR
ncbi:Regulator of chromosome condensation, RCC1 [Dillenia turbinata]|uniref:Regulator of chromosome condensation, RCC1 n=1 Tax=Dillenia turbinata TaxID=194707 RepID=A0AAN8UPL4_9MAGN